MKYSMMLGLFIKKETKPNLKLHNLKYFIAIYIVFVLRYSSLESLV